MAQPAQVKTGLPSGEFVVIDNGAPGVVSTNNSSGAAGGSGNWTGAGAQSGGFDLTANPSVAQGINSFGDTGTVLLDPVNDIASVNVKDATFNGNPVSTKAFSYTTLTKVLTNPQSATINFKNPA